VQFWLGTHIASWLRKSEVPLMISRRILGRYRSFPQAATWWALDSGGFSELSINGEWSITTKEYAAFVQRCYDEVGWLAWAAPMDWMCEPVVLEQTGKTVANHQELTVANYLDLKDLKPTLPIIPVVQGYSLDDYLRCVDLYAAHGVYLDQVPLVGVGSVCRRQSTPEIARIFKALRRRGLRLHGFGVKIDGLQAYGHIIDSADSMAWSYGGRRRKMFSDCSHNRCNNCMRWALTWREKIVRKDYLPREEQGRLL
jgi:hypothetical protein